jgi:hypothetical protein
MPNYLNIAMFVRNYHRHGGYVFLGVIDVVIRVFYFRFSSWGTDIEVCDLVLGRKFFLY